MASKPSLSRPMARSSSSFSSLLYRRISGPSSAESRSPLPRSTSRNSSSVQIGSSHCLGCITLRKEVCQNPPVSHMNSHDAFGHLQEATKQPQSFGLILSRLVPSMSNCHPSYSTGCGSLPCTLCFRLAIPSLVINILTRSSGIDFRICVKSYPRKNPTNAVPFG